MEWFEFALLVLVGALLLFMGWRIWKKEQITLIHDYHYKKVSQKDRKPYTERMGKAACIMGIGSVLAGVINLASHSGIGWIAFGIGFVIGIIWMVRTQMKYNRGIF